MPQRRGRPSSMLMEMLPLKQSSPFIKGIRLSGLQSGCISSPFTLEPIISSFIPMNRNKTKRTGAHKVGRSVPKRPQDKRKSQHKRTRKKKLQKGGKQSSIFHSQRLISHEELLIILTHTKKTYNYHFISGQK